MGWVLKLGAQAAIALAAAMYYAKGRWSLFWIMAVVFVTNSIVMVVNWRGGR